MTAHPHGAAARPATTLTAIEQELFPRHLHGTVEAIKVEWFALGQAAGPAGQPSAQRPAPATSPADAGLPDPVQDEVDEARALLAAFPNYDPDDQVKHLGPPPWAPGEQLTAWETAHGHDVRLDCYPEYGCRVEPKPLARAVVHLADALAAAQAAR